MAGARHMAREHILAVLYDLTLTIGGEVQLEVLLTKVLQRLLFHTSFPAGLVLLAPDAPERATLAAVVGDHVLAQAKGTPLQMPRDWSAGRAALFDDVAGILPLPIESRGYRHALWLPLPPEGVIVLLSPQLPDNQLPLTQVFAPVLRNLAKAVRLCRHSEQFKQTLISDRDRARSDLAEALQRSETERVFLRQLTNTFPDLVWIKDPDGVYLACNPPFERLYGASEGDILGKTDWDFVPDEVARAFRANDLAALAADAPHVNEEWLTFKADGYRGLFETIKKPMRDADGRLLGVLGVARDITQRRRDEEQLHLAASVFTHAREGIVITGADGLILQVNATFTEITGFTHEEAIGRNALTLQPGRADRAFHSELRRALATQGHWDGEVWAHRKSGELYAQLLRVSAVTDERSGTRHYVALFSDISRIKEHERQLEQSAHYDALTSLPNRVLFAERLQQAMTQSHRRGTLLAVAYMDLDGFKDINDRYGHEIGDRYLSELAVRMKAHLRGGDTLARLGGDEFAATLLDLDNVADGTRVLARLADSVSVPITVAGWTLQCTASIGLTFYPQSEPVNADQLLRQADQAMYQAKLAGKSRHLIFDPDQDRDVRGHHETIERIRAGLASGEFVLHYQPKVNMRTGEVRGAEALIRWQHPQQGLLPPGHFLPCIEGHALSIDLGDWVLEAALIQMEEWQASGLKMPVSVNVGAKQLQDPSFVNRLRQLLDRHPSISPSMLELEILETSALQDVLQASQVLVACRQLGLTCALDDFGTGYSTLSYLKRLPAQVLKIDQSFVRDMLDDPDDLAILEGVLGLAKAFRRRVIAEGVETVDHGVMLLQLGCEMAQGYGIARPMPAEELVRWVARWRPDPRWTNTALATPEDMPVLYAAVEHRAWVTQLIAFLHGKRGSSPEMHHSHCRFSTWLTSRRKSSVYGGRLLDDIDATHVKVHALAEELLTLHACERADDVTRGVPRLLALRDRLIDQLELLRAGAAAVGSDAGASTDTSTVFEPQ